MSSNVNNNSNPDANNARGSRGMSSELQAIMQRRLAKCDEEVGAPADEQLQDNELRIKTENLTSSNDVISRRRSPHSISPSTILNLNRHHSHDHQASFTFKTPSPTNVKVNSNDATGDGASASASASASAANQRTQKGSTGSFKYGKSPSVRTSQSHSHNMQSSTSSIMSMSSRTSFYGNSSFNYGDSLQNINVNLNANVNSEQPDSPFDEMDSPSQYSYAIQRKLLKKTNSGNDIRISPISPINTASSGAISVSVPTPTYASTSTSASGNINNNSNNNKIHQHPYVKRFSPTDFDKNISPKNSNPSPNETNHARVVSPTSFLKNKQQYQFKSIDYRNNLNSSSGARATSPPSVSSPTYMNNTTNNDAKSSPPTVPKDNFKDSALAPNDSTSTARPTSPSSLSPSQQQNRALSPLSLSHVTAMKQKLFNKTNPTNPNNPTNPMILSITPPPPPTSPPPARKSKKKKSPHHSKLKQKMKESDDSKLSTMKAITPLIFSSASSTTSSTGAKEGIEITFDAFKSSLGDDKKNDNSNNSNTAVVVEKESGDIEVKMSKGALHQGVGSTNTGTGIGTNTIAANKSESNKKPNAVLDAFQSSSSHFDSKSSLDLMEEVEDSGIHNVKFESMTAFESMNDWNDMSKPKTTPQNNTTSNSSNVAQQSMNMSSMAAFESFTDWSDVPQSSSTFINSDNTVKESTSSTFAFDEDQSMAFDQSFASTSTRNNWNWPSSTTTPSSSSKRNMMKRDTNLESNFDSTSFFQFDKFGPVLEEEKDGSKDDSVIIEDDFEDEPEINEDHLNDPVIFNTFPAIQSPYNHTGAVKNPLTDNLVICRQRNGGNWVIDEIDPTNSAIVASALISATEIRQKIASSYISSTDAEVDFLKKQVFCGVENVSKIAIGLHKQQNRTRVRVAAVIDLTVLGGASVGVNNTVCVIGLWQWGYASSGRTILLQNIIPSPPKNCFEPLSLCIADGLVFVAGKSKHATGQTNKSSIPVIYISKPHVRVAWSMSTVSSSKSASKVVSMAVTSYPHRRFKLLALALDDGSLTIWSYEKIVSTNRSTSGEKGQKGLFNQQMQLLHRLEGSSSFNEAEPTFKTLINEDSDNIVSENENAQCCNIAWIPSSASDSTSILVAASFPNGVAVYLIPTKRKQSVAIKPIGAAKTSSACHSCRVAWIEIPRFPPCLSIVFSGSIKSQVIYGLLCIHAYGCVNEVQKPFSLIIIGEDELPIQKITPWTDSHVIGNMKTFVSCEDGNVRAIFPSSRLYSKKKSHILHPSISMMANPLSSLALGLTSKGFVNTKRSNDDVIHLFSQLHWESSHQNGQSEDPETAPTSFVRHWLCSTKVGDRKDSKTPKKLQETSNDDSIPTGGAKTELLCELKCNIDCNSSLVPQRIVRNNTGNICAVLFSPITTSEEGTCRMDIDSDPIAFSMFRSDAESHHVTGIITLQNGRDIQFLNTDSDFKYFLLDESGLYLEEKSVPGTQDIPESDARKLQIFREGSVYSSKLTCHRVFLLSNNRFIFLLSRKIDGRYLLLCGGENDKFTAGAECIVQGIKSKLWLDEGERLVSLVELPSSNNSTVNIALSTSLKIMIVSCDTIFSVLSEYELNVICGSLAPVGSHCVSFLTKFSRQRCSIRYLTSLSGQFTTGTITTLPTSHLHQQNHFLALRPDRIVYQSTLTISNQNDKRSIKLPMTKPVFPLEPLIANAIAQSKCSNFINSKNDTKDILFTLMERFGVKLDRNPGNEHEGIGTKGIGFSSTIYQMLHEHGYSDLVSKHLNRGKVLTPWIPARAKINFDGDCKEILHTISDGDNFLSEYLQNVNENVSCGLPNPLDPVSNILSEYAVRALGQNKLGNALKSMDLIGSSSSHQDLAVLMLSMQLSSSKGNVESALSKLEMCDFNSSSLFSLNRAIHNGNSNINAEEKGEETKNRRIMSQFTPIYQRGISRTRRVGSHLIDYSVINSIDHNSDRPAAALKYDERKHVWNSGPFEDKEEILLLDSIEEWTGRCRPTIQGKEGAEVAAESGLGTLQKILGREKDDENNQEFDSEDESQCSSMEEWVEKVGEGRTDEDNLCLYLRFFEGADEDSNWKDEGLTDLSSFHNKPKLIQPDIFSIEATSSNVDEGESGKIQLLHDLVFNRDVDDEEMAGLFFEVKRGSSLDTGMFHGSNHQSRQRATLEFWFYLPKISKEVVLARRSICFQNGKNIESLCCVVEKESMIWELVVLPSGRLEFRGCGGQSMNSISSPDIQNGEKKGFAITEDHSDDEFDPGVVSWPREDGYGGWNHVSISFCCRGLDANECKVILAMKGTEVASSVVTFQLPTPGLDHGSDVDETLSISALMLGLGAKAGLRMTEVRAWACMRQLSDIKRSMDFYLDAAKIKKKLLKVSIRNNKVETKAKRSIVIPPKRLTKPKQLVAPPGNDQNRTRRLEATEKPNSESMFFGSNESFADFESTFKEKSDNFVPENPFSLGDEANIKSIETNSKNRLQSEESRTDEEAERNNKTDLQIKEPELLVEESCLLSEDVRKSAAAALVRGGPATRHFGGNRGGLPHDVMNIGSIVICGAQKTVIYSCVQSPRGKTYPIGASGAIVSDLTELSETDENENEFLCCFLAKDKRMVVFELKSKKVVVELQIATKLNFWRYLPPVAHGGNLVFFLLTPLGGFHWLPLSDSPSPRQVWKRGTELQGKKIVSYEEGGSNGLEGEDHHSAVALVLTCTSTASDPIQAWCIPLNNQSKPLCVSQDTLGAALFCTIPMHLSKKAFNPLLTMVTKEKNGVVIELLSLSNDPLQTESTNIKETLDFGPDEGIFETPTMAMGSSPSVFCLCWKKYLIIIVRDRGLLVHYEFFEDDLKLVFKHHLKHYVVDAGLKSSANNEKVEIFVLVSEPNKKDGRIVTIHLN